MIVSQTDSPDIVRGIPHSLDYAPPIIQDNTAMLNLFIPAGQTECVCDRQTDRSILLHVHN